MIVPKVGALFKLIDELWLNSVGDVFRIITYDEFSVTRPIKHLKEDRNAMFFNHGETSPGFVYMSEKSTETDFWNSVICERHF